MSMIGLIKQKSFNSFFKDFTAKRICSKLFQSLGATD